MVCDFSEAERKGFVDGLGKHAKDMEKNQRQFWEGFESRLKAHFRVKEANFPIEQFYAFCTVHFARSAARLYRNHSVVPIQRKEEFKQKLSVLQNVVTTPAQFEETTEYLKKEFPKCKKLLNWYLHPAKGKCIFPALSTEEFTGTTKNTQAEECMGRTIQQTCQQDHPSISQLFLHTPLQSCV